MNDSVRRHGSERALVWAFGASVVLHLLLLLVSWLAPLGSFASRVEPPENRINFTFAPRSERDSTGRAAAGLPQQSPSPAVPSPVGARALPAPETPARPESAPSRAAPPVEDRSEPQAAPEPAERRATQPGATVTLPDESLRDPFRRATERGEPGVDRRIPPPREEIDDAVEEFGRAFSRTVAKLPAGTVLPGTTTPQQVFVPNLDSMPATGYAVGNLEFSTRDFDWSDYGKQIYWAIWKAWHNRLYQTVFDFEKWSNETGEWELDHQNRVRFVIEKSGEVVRIKVMRPSGCDPLDASSSDALDEVVLPPLPEGFPGDSEEIHATFLARIPVFREVTRREECFTAPDGRTVCRWVETDSPVRWGRENVNVQPLMRQQLREMKARGYF